MTILYDYIGHSVLEILAAHPKKKFYPSEILEDIYDNENICHDIFDFTMEEILYGVTIEQVYKILLKYEPSEDSPIIKCKKYKKDAYQISHDGMSINKQYIDARMYYIKGFIDAMSIGNKDNIFDIMTIALNSWCCYVNKEWAKILKYQEDELDNLDCMKDSDE